MPEEKVSGEQVLTGLAVAGGVGLIGYGLYKYLKRKGKSVGDYGVLDGISFKYHGPATTLYICWGLKKGRGDFNNGENLAGGPTYFASKSVEVEESLEDVRYDFEDLDVRLKFESGIVEPGRSYDCYYWIATKPTADEDAILNIDVDADVFKITE